VAHKLAGGHTAIGAGGVGMKVDKLFITHIYHRLKTLFLYFNT
jgi:hypothetical protein